jgi:hypothetical protein
MKMIFLVALLQQRQLFLLALLSAVTAAAFVVVLPHQTTRTVSTRLYYDTEKPDPRVAAPPKELLETKRPHQQQQQPPQPQSLVQEEERPPVEDETVSTEEAADKGENEHGQDHSPVQKIRLRNNKEFWFVEEPGRFYEAKGESDEKPKLPLATILERTVDTVEDAVLHARRAPYEKGWIPYPQKDTNKDSSSSSSSTIPTIVVLGSGWASHALMKVADTVNKMRLIVISPVNHFVFTPSTYCILYTGIPLKEFFVLFLKNFLSPFIVFTTYLYCFLLQHSARIVGRGYRRISQHDGSNTSSESND